MTRLSTVLTGSLFGAFALAHPAALVERQSPVPFGQIITRCTQPGVVALTFDDGPVALTSEVMNMLADNNQRATFFVNGQNWDNINNHRSRVQRMVRDGHQVASHTWSHPFLTRIPTDEVVRQMDLLETALVDILGNFPTYMRQPYLDTNAQVEQILGQRGYHIISRDIETHDFDQNISTQDKIENFRRGLDNGGSIVLLHDVHESTVRTVTPAILSILNQRGIRSVTVGECLGDPAQNWYRTAR